MSNGRGYSFYIVEEEGTLNVFFLLKNKLFFVLDLIVRV